MAHQEKNIEDKELININKGTSIVSYIGIIGIITFVTIAVLQITMGQARELARAQSLLSASNSDDSLQEILSNINKKIEIISADSEFAKLSNKLNDCPKIIKSTDPNIIKRNLILSIRNDSINKENRKVIASIDSVNILYNNKYYELKNSERKLIEITVTSIKEEAKYYKQSDSMKIIIRSIRDSLKIYKLELKTCNESKKRRRLWPIPINNSK